MKVTLPPARLKGEVTLSALTSATVDLSWQVETPRSLDSEQAPIVLPLPVAVNAGVTPGTRLLFTSLSVIVTVENETPLANTGLVPLMLELPATGAPATKVTVPPILSKGEIRRRVFTSAEAEVRAQVTFPSSSVV